MKGFVVTRNELAVIGRWDVEHVQQVVHLHANHTASLLVAAKLVAFMQHKPRNKQDSLQTIINNAAQF